MTSKPPRNIAASVRQRLTNLSRERNEEFQFVLTRYGLERLLYRLSISPYASQFILKGAALFQLWTGQPHRSTRDLDLLGYGSPSPERLQTIFSEVCSLTVDDDDGLVFSPTTIQAEQIKEDAEYQGIRLRIECRLGNARLALQIDIGFGDAVTPEALSTIYPTLLEFPAPQLRAYPRETVVAEKFQAMVALGIANSRMKDFYDVWTLARQFEFDGTLLRSAIRATFERRQTAIPTIPPLALTAEFANDQSKASQWNAFLKKGKLVETPPPFTEVVELLQKFLMPPTIASSEPLPWRYSWTAQEWRLSSKS
jgi:predicted nucleotidyltransferase component of viral defense system